jgi:[protein-PII] uridylyltransferase
MYRTHYSDSQLFDPQQFVDALKSGASALSVFRDALKRGHEVLKARFQSHHNASEYVKRRAWLVDQILWRAWQQYSWREADNIALIAVGGYGRGELHPFSDVDIMILFQHEPEDPETLSNVESFITFLWDIRLEVGHSVRTLEECAQEAGSDITIATNLVEARLLIGESELFRTMQARISAEYMWTSKEFFEAKVKERVERHRKYHDTAYNLEPNIKEGPGGLRDIQMIGWVAKRHFGASTLYDLVQHGFLTEFEYQSLIAGQEFIWRIRCQLHILAGRREDRLSFDYQRPLASIFGFHDDEAHLGVENFMKQYYRTIMELGTLNDMLMQLFQEVLLYSDAAASMYGLNKRFRVHNDFIEVTYDKVFLHYPFALLEIFLLMQQHPEIKGVRASTIRLIRQYKWLIDYAFHRDLRARSLFFEIIRQPRGLTHALRNMNRYGILGAYIPAFGRIIGQMQYDLFHVYTVDQHTIFVIRNLRRFNMTEHVNEFPFCSKIAQTLPKPELLYLAGLFHDIAKGRGGDHSQLGELEALHFCESHGLSDYDARLVGWLVKNHLILSTTAQRQDISDPEVISAFADRIGDPVRLDYLYLLTVADIRATNPTLWNSWKDSLLAELYRKTKYVLCYGMDKTLDKQVRIQEVQTQAWQLLSEQQEDFARITALWADLGDNYFLRSLPIDVARETSAMLHHQQQDAPLVLERLDRQGGTDVLIYTLDRDYLFADTTYCLEQQHINIVDAYIVPTQRAYTIAGYTILEENGTALSKERIEEVLHSLRQALIRDTNVPFCPINRRLPRQLKHFPVPTRITFAQDPHNQTLTLMEVITTDRPGILSRIAQAFVSCEVRLHKAKIATFGSRVEDVFYISDMQDQALHSADQLDNLREQLSLLLDADLSPIPNHPLSI